MNFEGYAYRLICGLPVFLVLLIGMALCFQQHWRNQKVCTLVGIALAMALGVRIVFPFLMQVFYQAVINRLDPAQLRGQMLMLVPTLLYAAAAVIWGLVLWAIFGGGGVVRSVQEQDDMYDESGGDRRRIDH